MKGIFTKAGARGGGALGAVLLTIFLDLVGFSILFPLMPALLAHYIPENGPETLIGRIETLLSGLSPAAAGGHGVVSLILFGGAVGSVFSILQFLFAPVWGRLSDRYGRRRILLFTTSLTDAGYLLWVVSGNFWMFLAARVACGIMAGNISVATAAVADATSAENRTKGMALLGMAFATGFMVGPVIGGVASGIHLEGLLPAFGPMGLNPFSGAALISLLLSATNFLWVYFFFPETLKAEHRAEARISFNPLGNLHVEGCLARRIVALNFAFLLLASGIEFSLTFLAMERLGYGPRENIAIFIFGGVITTTLQGLLVRKRKTRGLAGERRVAMIGIAASICGMVILSLAQSTPVFFFGLFFKSSAMALFAPTVTSLVSLCTPPDRQGAVMGTFRAMGSLARAFGPVFAGVLYWSVGSRVTFLCSALILLVPLSMALRLPVKNGERCGNDLPPVIPPEV